MLAGYNGKQEVVFDLPSTGLTNYPIVAWAAEYGQGHPRYVTNAPDGTVWIYFDYYHPFVGDIDTNQLAPVFPGPIIITNGTFTLDNNTTSPRPWYDYHSPPNLDWNGVTNNPPFFPPGFFGPLPGNSDWDRIKDMLGHSVGGNIPGLGYHFQASQNPTTNSATWHTIGTVNVAQSGEPSITWSTNTSDWFMSSTNLPPALFFRLVSPPMVTGP
jgi:hypothetical protein